MEVVRARIGTAGWSVPAPRAAAFPREGAHLERYARVMNCVEINSSFYRPHRITTWQRWAASVPIDFKFSVKAPKRITHEKSLACEVAELQDFLDQVSELGSKLGPLLFQLPPSFQFERKRVEELFVMLRANFGGAVALEPRHTTWFSAEVEDLLVQHRIARVAADPARVPQAAHPGGWNGLRYFRLHGSPRMYYSDYEERFLTALATQLLECSEDAETWCIFDNTAFGAATGNALRLMELIAGAVPDSHSFMGK